MDEKHRRSSPVDDLHDARADPIWSPPGAPTGVGRVPWQRVGGVGGYLGLHEPADLGDSVEGEGVEGEGVEGGPVSGAVSPSAPGQVLVLAGQVTREVLDWYGSPGTGVLAGVRVVEASGVAFLDEAGRALLLRVHLATRGQGRRVLLPGPSSAVVDALTRHGVLGLFEVCPPVEGPVAHSKDIGSPGRGYCGPRRPCSGARCWCRAEAGMDQHDVPQAAHAPAATASAGAGLSYEAAGARVLEHLERVLPLGAWAVTRHEEDLQRFLDARPLDHAHVRPGLRVPWQASLCRRRVAGAPAVAPRLDEVPAYADVALVRQWSLRSYVAAPIRGVDGRVFGTLAGYGARELDPVEADDARSLVELLADLLGQILHGQDLREQAHVREVQLHRLATRDGLTGLATRAVLYDRLAHALELHRTTGGTGGRAVSVVLMDVDDLKTMNDVHGHAAGDHVLTALASTWAGHAGPGDTVARLGGDEFALLVEDGAAEEVARRVEADLTGVHHRPDGTVVPVTVSAGMTHLPGSATVVPTPGELLGRADAAMYLAKHAGGGRLVQHEDLPAGVAARAWATAPAATQARARAGAEPEAPRRELVPVCDVCRADCHSSDTPGDADRRGPVRWACPEHGWRPSPVLVRR